MRENERKKQRERESWKERKDGFKSKETPGWNFFKVFDFQTKPGNFLIPCKNLLLLPLSLLSFFPSFYLSRSLTFLSRSDHVKLIHGLITQLMKEEKKERKEEKKEIDRKKGRERKRQD